MTVLARHVEAAVNKMYTGVRPRTINGTVMFGIICKYYRASVAIEVSKPKKEVPSADVSQHLTIWIGFYDSEGRDIDMADSTIVGAVCEELQQAVSWSTIQIVPGLNGLDEFVLNRTIDTGRYDLRCAENLSLDSKFFRTMFRMLGEFEKIAPAVAQVCTGKIDHADGLCDVIEMSHQGDPC